VEALAWWLIPITATLLAVLWVAWSGRPRRPADAHVTLAQHRRFTEALSPPVPLPQRPQTPNDEADYSPQHRRSA